MFQFMQKKQYALAPKAVHHRDQALMRGVALQVFNVLLDTVSSRFGLEDLMWILASSLHVRAAGIQLVQALNA
jgi:inner membrane protein involved in colicin E2 resistance